MKATILYRFIGNFRDPWLLLTLIRRMENKMKATILYRFIGNFRDPWLLLTLIRRMENKMKATILYRFIGDIGILDDVRYRFC